MQLRITKWAVAAFISITAQAGECDHTPTEFHCVKYVSAYDADTIKVNLPNIHPLLGDRISVRVFGVDSPEIKGQTKCEKEKAIKARDLVRTWLSTAKRIDLVNIGRDKYFRVLARVRIDGKDLSDKLIELKLAYPYYGDTKEIRNWCE